MRIIYELQYKLIFDSFNKTSFISNFKMRNIVTYVPLAITNNILFFKASHNIALI